MATNQQISPEQMRQLRAQQATTLIETPEQPLPQGASYEQQIEYAKKQIEQQRQQVSKYEQSLQPGRRTQAFTPRQQRLQRAQQIEIGKGEVVKATAELAKSAADVGKFEQQVKDLRAAEAYQAAYDQVMKHYRKGMLWAVAAFGEGLEKKIARQMIKQGYSSSLGGLLEQEQYKQRQNLLKEIKLGNVPDVTIKGSTIISSSTNKPLTIGKAAEKYIQSQSTGFESMNFPGYYNPKTGEVVSMKPEDAARLGYQKVTTTGFNPQTGQYVITSDTGLLTPRQMAIKEIIERTPEASILFGGAKTSEMISTKMPTEFIVGGKQTSQTINPLTEFLSPPKSAYEIAQRQAPYSQKEMLEMTKVTQRLMQVPMRFGGTKLVPVTEGYTGPMFTQVFYEDGSKELTTPDGKKYYTPAPKADKMDRILGTPSRVIGGALAEVSAKAFTEVPISTKNLYVFLDKEGNVIKGKIPSRKEWTLMQEKKWVKENYDALKEGKQKVFYNQKKVEDSYDYNFRRTSVREVTGKNKITISEYEQLTGVTTPLSLIPRSYGEAALTGYFVTKVPMIPGVVNKLVASTAIVGSRPIVSESMKLYEKLPTPKTRIGRFGKAALFFGAQEAINPYIGLAYAKDFTTNLLTAPAPTLKETGKFIYEKPEEFLGGLVGGSLAGGIRRGVIKRLPEKGIKSEEFLSTQFENLQNRPTARALEFYDINTGRLLKDKILLVQDKNSGKLQTPGGGIDEIRFKFKKYKNMPLTEWRKFIYSNAQKAEQLRRQALLAELKQELNLGKNDVLRLEKLRPNFYGDEAFFNYRVYVDSNFIFDKMKPSSDAKAIKYVSPIEAYRLSPSYPTAMERGFGLLTPVRYKEAMGIPAERALQKYLGVKEEARVRVESPLFGGGLLPDNSSFSQLVISRTRGLGEYITKENLVSLLDKGIITKAEFNILLKKLESIKTKVSPKKVTTDLASIEEALRKLYEKNKDKRYVEAPYNARELLKGKPWSTQDIKLLKELLNKRNKLSKQPQQFNLLSSEYRGKEALTLKDLIQNTNILERAKQVLSKKFDKNQVGVMTSMEIVSDFILFKEGKLPRALVERISPTERVVYGATSRYDLVDQKRFTDITKKLEKRYGKEVLARTPVNKISDLLNILDLKQADLIFYKSFIRDYLAPKKTFFTHLSTQPFSAASIKEFFKKERMIAAGKTKRAAGLTRGLYVAPELYAKGEKGPRGQIRKETLGYGGLVYFGIGSYKGYQLSLLPSIKKPTTYVLKQRASGEAFLNNMVSRAKTSKAEALKVARELEQKAGSVQPTINTLLSKEGEFFVTPGTTIVIAKKLSSGRIAGYTKYTYKLVLKKLTKEEAARINANAQKIKQSRSPIERQKAISNLKKIMGEPIKKEPVLSSELIPRRTIQVRPPKVPVGKESETMKSMQSILLPRLREVPKSRERQIRERVPVREREVKMKERESLRVRELPGYLVREAKAKPQREFKPREKARETPKENPLNTIFRPRESKDPFGGAFGVKVKRPKKKPTGYQLTPTITQKLYKIRRKGGPSRRPRGFEIARL